MNTNSQKLWEALKNSFQILQDWNSWLNKHGVDGTLIDEADSVSFINNEQRKAIVLQYEPNDSHPISAWASVFGEAPSETIEQLVLVYSDSKKAQEIFPELVEKWISPSMTIKEMSAIIKLKING
jgi:uncharacterized membrane protein